MGDVFLSLSPFLVRAFYFSSVLPFRYAHTDSEYILFDAFTISWNDDITCAQLSYASAVRLFDFIVHILYDWEKKECYEDFLCHSILLHVTCGEEKKNVVAVAATTSAIIKN